jgi:hypothetical protein
MAAAANDKLLAFALTAGFIGGGYWLMRGRRKAETLSVDVEAARPTRHMVDLADRLDRQRLKLWLEEAEKQDAAAAAATAAAGTAAVASQPPSAPGGAASTATSSLR